MLATFSVLVMLSNDGTYQRQLSFKVPTDCIAAADMLNKRLPDAKKVIANSLTAQKAKDKMDAIVRYTCIDGVVSNPDDQ